MGLARFAPLGGSRWTTEVTLPGRTEAGHGESVDAEVVDGGFLDALRIPLRAGRAFDAGDREGSAPVAVVNETMARKFWPGRSALGQTVEMDGRRIQVVGVTADARFAPEVQAAPPMIFLPFAQSYQPEMVLHVRASGDPGAVLAGIRREIRAMDPDIAPMQSQPLQEMIRATLLPQRIGALAIGGFGAVGLLLAAIGVYGVLAYRVSMRTREIGIRIALGARIGNVVGIVVGSSLRLALIGTGIGLLVALGVGRLLSGMLHGVSPTDPLAFGGVALLLVGVALLASWIPARRAARVDPMVALRTE